MLDHVHKRQETDNVNIQHKNHVSVKSEGVVLQ